MALFFMLWKKKKKKPQPTIAHCVFPQGDNIKEGNKMNDITFQVNGPTLSHEFYHMKLKSMEKI